MNEDYRELVEYLDKKFQETATKDTVADLTNRVISVEEKIETLATKEDVNSLLNAIDSYAKKADAYFQEMVMLAHKVDRHEKWIQQLADKLGIKLQY